ncbi:MAG: Hsp20/alpha crystallin family protein [Planctomycetaceae bacterium]|nr:Hsp20/alpha crystallin family protein [Planctomycetaceae bacterium]
MPLFRFGQNWDPFGDLEREVDRLLRSVDLTFHGIRMGRQYPAVNLYELEDEYVLTAELPGTKIEDLELTFAGGILTLKGCRDDSEDVPEHRFRRSERFRGAWQRALSLPERIREEDLTATFTDGVLRVRLPKGAQTPARQIAVTEGNDDPSRSEAPDHVG